MARCNVYKPQTLHCRQMRIGQWELKILNLLYNSDDYRARISEIKEKLSGKKKLEWHRMSRDSYEKTNIVHKSIARATKTLEDKGLVERVGYVDINQNLSKIISLELTEKGIIEYHKRMK